IDTDDLPVAAGKHRRGGKSDISEPHHGDTFKRHQYHSAEASAHGSVARSRLKPHPPFEVRADNSIDAVQQSTATRLEAFSREVVPTLRRRRHSMLFQHLPIPAPPIRSISATRNYLPAIVLRRFHISVAQPAKFLKSPLHDMPEQSRFFSEVRCGSEKPI